MAHSSVYDSQLNFALLTLAAVYVVLRPSVAGFVVLLLLQCFDAFYRMPFTTNHWIFTAFVNLTILQALLYQIIKRRSFRNDEETLFMTFAPVVRIEVIILYFFAVFHKLNSGFFSPETSCASTLLHAQHIDGIIPLTPRLLAFNAWFTLSVELMIPLFLLFRKTRNIGLITGLLFHCVLSYSSYNGFYDFSSMIFALYFLFIAPEFSLKIYDKLIEIRNVWRRPRKYSFGRLFILCAFIIAAFIILVVLNKRFNSVATVNLYFWTLYSIAFAGLFIAYGYRTEGALAKPNFLLPQWTFLVMPVIVFLNGTSPYLGLKTENSYSMFSNLRTEGGVTNHYLIPASVQLFGYQKDVVEIISSTDPRLQDLANKQTALVLFEFRKHLHERTPRRVDYLLNGKKATFIAGQSQEPGLEKNPYVLSKLMRFRSFSKEEPQPCGH
jgi:hypothetical protein